MPIPLDAGRLHLVMSETEEESMSELKKYHGGVDGYARDARKFHKLCYTKDAQVPLEEIRAAFLDLLDKSAGTRFEVWTHERMAEEYLSRGMTEQATNEADIAVSLATPGYDSPLARIILAQIKADAP